MEQFSDYIQDAVQTYEATIEPDQFRLMITTPQKSEEDTTDFHSYVFNITEDGTLVLEKHTMNGQEAEKTIPNAVKGILEENTIINDDIVIPEE